MIYMERLNGFTSSCRPCRSPASSRSAFSLIELLVVILIISILSGIVLTAMSGSDDSRSLDSGITRLDSLFSLARSAAITRKQKTRVLISLDGSNLDPNDPDKLNKTQHMLRYATIVYFDDTDPSPQWKVYAEGEFLPEGVYFSPGLSTMSSDAESLYPWTLDINLSTMLVSDSPDDSALENPYKGSFSGNTETISGHGANKWYAFEFSSNGTFTNPGVGVVLISGILESPTRLVIPLEDGVEATDIAKGFVVFRSGKVLHYKSGEQIKGN